MADALRSSRLLGRPDSADDIDGLTRMTVRDAAPTAGPQFTTRPGVPRRTLTLDRDILHLAVAGEGAAISVRLPTAAGVMWWPDGALRILRPTATPSWSSRTGGVTAKL